jgi:hypothetical protein
MGYQRSLCLKGSRSAAGWSAGQHESPAAARQRQQRRKSGSGSLFAAAGMSTMVLNFNPDIKV